MSGGADWIWWIVGAAIAAGFAWYFWTVGAAIVRSVIQLVQTIQNWPQTRRAMVEAEVRAGGRYPLWFRAARVVIILALLGLLAYTAWCRFS
jgi:hypothetical protein